ncbi:putative ribonuclease H protein [Sesamum angolense]|uniref:Ribonuclease H protein n=1 Tax=Sesamum angolense TaxID=2727404 RepID=A0AAE1T9L3_9LAMI|nr:putative ribonuclease H protein [Sesamum angolense]
MVPRLSALHTKKTPLTATSMDGDERYRTFQASEAHPPPFFRWSVEIVHYSPAGHILEQNGKSHHPIEAVLSSPTDHILPIENRLPSPTWNRTAPPLKHGAPTPLPVPLFTAERPPTVIPATTVASASQFFIATVQKSEADETVAVQQSETAVTAADRDGVEPSLNSSISRRNVTKSVPAPAEIQSPMHSMGIFIGNVPLQTPGSDFSCDKFAASFNNSTRKTLSYVNPSIQNGEIVVRPSIDVVHEGSPTEIAMEEVIEGPWLFQGQPIVLQRWEPGMVLRKHKHTQVPVWIRLRHLPVEFWTDDGLSTKRTVQPPVSRPDVTKGADESLRSFRPGSYKQPLAYCYVMNAGIWNVRLNRRDHQVAVKELVSEFSEGDRSLWKRLDRLIVNDAWLGQWPCSHYHCLNARTSDHSPLVIRGDTVSIRKKKGDLSMNVKLAAEFLGHASTEGEDSMVKGWRSMLENLLPKGGHEKSIQEEDKAPGPDGYSSGFYKAAWPVIGDEVVKAILEFFTTGRLLKQVNTTMLALIPKRLRLVLDAMISPSQNAFVPGRSIGDNILLAQEMFTGYNRQGLPKRCALKVDLRKAYDTVEWDFLIAALQLFGFPDIFIGWIEECVTTPMFSVCINGNPHGFSRVLGGCDRDPMSPFLFVLVMEVLQLMMQQLIDQNEGFSYHWRCKELGLFQLCFADDLLLFCKADVASVQEEREHLIAALQFQEGHLPLRYLGLPLLASRLSISDCHPLLLKVDSRIKGWDSIQLSFAGRLQLIKSVLMSLNVYWAMAFILPKGVIREVEKRMRNFLWKGNSTVGYPKVAWSSVCRPKEEGGLGIRDILALNKALMCRHLWNVIQGNQSSIWVRWIAHNHLRHKSVWTVDVKGGSWGWRKLLRLRSALLPYIELKIGMGNLFLFGMTPGIVSAH